MLNSVGANVKPQKEFFTIAQSVNHLTQGRNPATKYKGSFTPNLRVNAPTSLA